MPSSLELRPYQKEALALMSDGRHQCEFDEMGLGKSVITLKHLERVTEEGEKILIIGPTNSLYVWKQEIEKWTGHKSLLYWGSPKERAELMGQLAKAKDDLRYVITSTGVFSELIEMPWRHFIADEIHRWGLLNSKTKTFIQLYKLRRRVDQSMLLTGTPIRQGCIDLFAPLNMTTEGNYVDGLNRYWHFVNKWCIVNETPFGKQIDRRPRNLISFRDMWRKYAVRRLTEEVKTDLPLKRRAVVPVCMTAKQRIIHKELMAELIYLDTDTDTLTTAQNKLVAGLRARQLLVCPRLLGVDEDGAGLDYLKEIIPDYVQSEKPVVIFTPFRDAVDLIADAIDEACRDISNWRSRGRSIYKLHGQMTPAQFGDCWMSFQNAELTGKRKVLICTVQSGASFHATEAATCFFLGCEYDFNHNEQAEKRLHRMGQSLPVECNYLLYEGDVMDQEIRQILNEKKQAATWILSSDQQYADLLHQIKEGGKNA